MPFPQTVDAVPSRATNLGGNDGAKHSAYDDAVALILTRIQTFAASGGWPGGASLKTYIDDKTSTIRSKNGTRFDVGVGIGDVDSGDFRPEEGKIRRVVNTELVQEWAVGVSTFFSDLGVTGKLFVSGMAENALAGQELRWDATAGEIYRHASTRRQKENEREITDGLEKLRAMRPVRYDVIGRPSNVGGQSVDVASFIAEDMHQVDPAVRTLGEDGQPNGLISSGIIAFTVAAVRELDRFVTEQLGAVDKQIRGVNGSLNGLIDSMADTFAEHKTRGDDLEKAIAGWSERVDQLDLRLSTAVNDVAESIPEPTEAAPEVTAEDVEQLRGELAELRSMVQRLDVRRFG